MTEPSTSDIQALGTPASLPGERSPSGLRAAVLNAAAALGEGLAETAGSRGGVTLERPPRADFGDYSTNAALLLAPRLRSPPREVAERLGAELERALGEMLERFEVAGPGFVNLYFTDRWLIEALVGVLASGEGSRARIEPTGDGSAEHDRLAGPVMIEFVSANPTGPMHVGHARNAAYGDALARLLEFSGERVMREYYVNDAGTQVGVFGASVQAVARGEELPEGGYQGDYVAELAGRIPDAAGADVGEVGREAVALMVEEIKSSLKAFGVKDFDHWTYESALHAGDPSPVAHTLSLLEQ
ncbi:MAG TPA: arginine--tRNA ligase, partial [Solirubrobacteraceae bacterium]|nr:arginine--tRNA ligase [Solirubrobacteraceae bacterium]